ncbi:unnamed protein product, partial [Choristocarpus tenellus]
MNTCWEVLLVFLAIAGEALAFTAMPCRGACSVGRNAARIKLAQRGRASSSLLAWEGDSFTDCRPVSRTEALSTLVVTASALLLGPTAGALAQDQLPTVGKITKNGVKYFDFRIGTGESPRWGQDCVIRYVMYGRSSPDAKLSRIDTSDNNGEHYLFKHGNGHQIKGMEEGLHSMRVGGKRRIVFPSQMGYTVQGLGPYPGDARNRDILAKFVNTFEVSPGGEFVLDVELFDCFDDEADQGYYEDEVFSDEELEEALRETSKFTGGMPFEQLPGQVTLPAGGT